MDNYNKKRFYYNCKFISKDIFDLIKDMIKIYIEKVKAVKCIFDKGEIIMLIKDGNDEVINIGNLGKGNVLKIKSTIEKGYLAPSIIFSKVKKMGYKYIKNNIEIFNSQNIDNNNISLNESKINLEINEKKNESEKPKSEDNQKYINQIEELKRQLLEEKENNNKLKSENKKLEQENIDFKKKSEEELEKFQNYINQLKNELINKNKEIKNYILEINELKENKNEITTIKPGEKIFSVLFMSQGSNEIVNYSMTCKNTELFVRLEERLYEDYPQFKKKEPVFMVDTRRILRFQTLDENKIKRNDIISLFVDDS